MLTSFRVARAVAVTVSSCLVPGAIAALLLGACARGSPPPQAEARAQPRPFDPRTTTPASPRVVDRGLPVSKGGGVYKIGPPYKVADRWYIPQEDPAYDRTGRASWYGTDFHGRRTANGEVFDMNALTAAHPTLPLPSYAYVTNLANGRTILVRLNDRGPYARDRMIDLSREAARQLGFEVHGTADVRVRYAGRAPLDGNDDRERRFLAGQPWRRLAAAR